MGPVRFVAAPPDHGDNHIGEHHAMWSRFLPIFAGTAARGSSISSRPDYCWLGGVKLRCWKSAALFLLSARWGCAACSGRRPGSARVPSLKTLPPRLAEPYESTMSRSDRAARSCRIAAAGWLLRHRGVRAVGRLPTSSTARLKDRREVVLEVEVGAVDAGALGVNARARRCPARQVGGRRPGCGARCSCMLELELVDDDVTGRRLKKLAVMVSAWATTNMH